MTSNPVGDQLILEGFEDFLVGDHREPWEGRSPRALTKGHGMVILKAQAKKSMSDFVRDENQFDLWLPMKKCASVYVGAPLLIPLLEGTSRG